MQFLQSFKRYGLVLASVVALVLVTLWPISKASAVSQTETIWGASDPAALVATDDTAAVELGTKFTAVVAGQATGVRFFKATTNTGTHTGTLWNTSGKALAKVTFSNETASGWQVASFGTPVNLVAGRSYVVSYHTNVGNYSYVENFSGASTTPDLRVPSTNAGVYRYGGSGYPTSTWHSSQYWVDLTLVPGTSSTGTPTPSATTSSSTPTPTATTTTPVPSPTVTTSTPVPTVTSTTPTPTATSSTPSTGQANCASQPSRCGYPDETNTGPVAGTVLRRVPQDITSGTGWHWDTRGWLQVDSDYAVVENVIVNSSIEVQGTGAIVRNNVIPVGGEGWAVALRHTTNAQVYNNTIGVTGASPRLMVGIKDIYGDSTGMHIYANNITNTSTGIQVGEGLIEDNYIHDMGYQSGDHLNGTTSNGSTDMMTIRHNTILNSYGQTDAISLFQDFGLEANRLITDNLVAGGGYTIYGGDNRNYGQTYNIKITNNRFSRVYFPNGGYYGPLAAFDASGTNNLWSGNFWDDTLAAV